MRRNDNNKFNKETQVEIKARGETLKKAFNKVYRISIEDSPLLYWLLAI